MTPSTLTESLDQIETEWQFIPNDLASLRTRLQGECDLTGFRLVHREPLDLVDHYLDTADSRLARAGYALRLRSDGTHCEATLKALTRSAAGPQRRREITQPVAHAGKQALLGESGPVAERARAVAGKEPLRTLFTAQTHRDVFQAMREDRDAAEIVLDQTTLRSDDDRPIGSLQRVEVELHDSTAESVQPLLEQLGERGMLRPASSGKFEAGIAAVGRQLPAPPETMAVEFAPSMPAGIVTRLLLSRQLEAWRSLEPAVRLGDDPEYLHQLRVTGRRAIAMLRLLEAVPTARAAKLRPRVQGLLRRMSAARDTDVQLAESTAISRLLPGGELGPLLDRLQKQRARQQRALLRVLDAARTAQLFAALDRLAQPASAAHRGPTIAAVARRVVRKRFRKLRASAALAGQDANPANCHAMRLDAKKLRYVAEALVVIYGEPMQRFLRSLQKLQNLLGRINDDHHALSSLESLVPRRRGALPATVIFAMGRMAERHHEQIDRQLAALPDAWRRVSGKRWRRLRKQLRSAEHAVTTGNTKVSKQARD
jgi:CHAD domain-containing protein